MFSSILKVIPKLDDSALKAMERQLSSRFAKVAKGFGKGLASVIKGGGIAGIGLALIDKVLNPLKETQEAIDRMLKSSDDIATNAGQFNTSTGKLFKLIQLGKATGLDQDNLFTLINKFQNSVAEAKADPNKPSAVKNFTGQTDAAVGFFEFIQSLKQMPKDQQLLVQQQVFGEKQILRMADFLQADFPKLIKETGLDKLTAEKLGNSIDSMGKLNDLADVLAVRRENTDVVSKGRLITEGMVRSRDTSERIALQRENERIASYQNLATLSQTADKISGLVEQGVALLGGFITKLLPAVDRMANAVEKLMKSPIARGIKGLFGGKGD